MSAAVEKYILTQKELHFGYIKETFHAGAVIELLNGKIVVDGRKFDDVRDLDILKRQAAKNPSKPWIIPFSEESLESIKGARPVVPVFQPKPKPGDNMPVVTSDEDSHQSIDISNTQVAKNKQAARDDHKRIIKEGKLPIIKGDESVEDRIASLKGKNDPSSIAERARLKQSRATMPVVHDDSLGMGVSGKTMAMNAGQVLPSREVVEARAEETRALAEARKREAEGRRKVTITEDEEVAEATESDLTARPLTTRTAEPEIDSPVATVVIDTKKSAEVDTVKAENADLKSRLARLEAMMEAQMAIQSDARKPVHA